jgi:FkbM family methyltransferase
MVSNLARWLVQRRFYTIADWMLTGASFLAGKGNRIRYNKSGYWSHRQKGWIINEAFPNIRLDIKGIQDFNQQVYFHQYQPSLNDIVIDVGAGIGTESIFLSKAVGNKGIVYAIEASPSTYRILRANIEDNKLQNVHCFNIAIADRHGQLKISDAVENHIANSVFEDQGVEVEALTMDEFFVGNDIKTVDFLKVNIEGAEKLLVRSFNGIDKVHYIAISCHDFLGRRTGNPVFFTREIIVTFLLQHDFEISSRNSGVDYEDDWIYGRNKLFTKNHGR